MAFSDDYYDFFCGNDRRLVKVSIQNNTFHTITIEADVARSIDFSGGTRKVETIRLAKCLKMGKIIWPDRTGSIRRLFISNCDTISRLDISELTSLEELSIVNCRNLDEVAGIPSTLKELNIHNTKISSLDISDATHLQKVNVLTTSPVFNIDASNQRTLQIFNVITSKAKDEDSKPSEINLSGSHATHDIFIDVGNNNVDLNLEKCTMLTNAIILSGDETRIKSIDDCKNLEFIHIANQSIEFDKPTEHTIKKLIATSDKDIDKEIKAIRELSKEFYELATTSKPSTEDRETVVRQNGSIREVEHGGRGVTINLLSTPEDLMHYKEEQDLFKFKKELEDDETRLLGNPEAFAYFIKRPEQLKVAHELFPKARTHKEGEIDNQQAEQLIQQWLDNKEKLKPNTLLLTDNHLRNPVIFKFLNQIMLRPRYLYFKNRRYLFGLYNRLLFIGNWYYFKNRLPFLAALISPLPLYAFMSPFMSPIMLTPHNMAIYPRNLMYSYGVLNSGGVLGSVGQNTLSQNQLAALSKQFFDDLRYVQWLGELEREQRDLHYRQQLAADDQPPNAAIISRSPDDQFAFDAGAQSKPRGDTVPTQDRIGGQAQSPPQQHLDDIPQVLLDGQGNAGIPGTTSPKKGVGKLFPDVPDQQLIDKDALDSPPDDQHLIHGESQVKPLKAVPPIKADDIPQSKLGDDKKIGIPGSSEQQQGKGRILPDIPDAVNIDKYAENKPFDDQELIDAEAQGPRKPLDKVPPMSAEGDPQHLLDKNRTRKDMSVDPQHLIEGNASAKGLHEVPKLAAKPTKQDKLVGDKKAVEPSESPVNDNEFYDAHLIDAEAQSQPPMSADKLTAIPTDDQSLIGKKKGIVEPVKAEGLFQKIINVARKATDYVRPGNTDPLQTDPAHQQQMLAAKMTKKESITPKAVEKLKVAKDIEQHGLSAKQVAKEPVPGIPPHHMLFKNDPGKLPEIYDQVAIHAQAKSGQTTTPAERLLESSRKLADAVSDMVAAANAYNDKQEKKSESIERASKYIAIATNSLENTDIVVPTAAEATVPESISADELLYAANTVMISLKNLYEACAFELPINQVHKKENKDTDAELQVKQQLMTVLKGARTIYIDQHNLDSKQEGMFGYQHGVQRARLNLLSQLIRAVEQHQKLPSVELDVLLSELMKDQGLSYAVNGIKPQIIEYLSLQPKTEKGPKPKDSK